MSGLKGGRLSALAVVMLAAASLACGSLGAPAATPQPTLPAPVRWHQPAGSSAISPPALADGLLVYLTAESSRVIALDAATGLEKWHYTLNVSNTLDRPLGVTNGVIAVEESLLDEAGKDRTRVVALDLHSGQRVWQTWQSPDENALFLYQPVAADGVIYYEIEPSPGHRLLTAVAAATGSVQWSSPLTGTSMAGDPVVNGGLVLAPIDHVSASSTDTATTDILALDAATGAPRWTVALGSLAPSILAAGSGRVFATTPDGHCWAIDAATGRVDWKFQFDDDQPAPPLLAGDTLYFGDGQGRLRALDAASGALRWTATLARGIRRRPAVGGGQVYVGSDDGYLNTLEGATGHLLWRTQNHLAHPFAANPYIPPMDTEPVVTSGTLYYFNVEELVALSVP